MKSKTAPEAVDPADQAVATPAPPAPPELPSSLPVDEWHGLGGSYEMVNGQRRRVQGPDPSP